MNPFDQLELDVLAATGDIELAEMSRLVCYMFGWHPETVTVELFTGTLYA